MVYIYLKKLELVIELFFFFFVYKKMFKSTKKKLFNKIN